MTVESSKKIDEIMFETNDKITAIVEEIRLIRFSNMKENEKEEKYDILREEFKKIMCTEENRVKEVMEEGNS